MILRSHFNSYKVNTSLAAGVLFILLSVPATTSAQIFNPYIAVFTGQSQGNWSHGFDSISLDWRGAKSIEVGFDIFGLTISPGFLAVDEVQWESSDGNNTYDLQYTALYLNLGARERFGLYFAGGLNITFWDVLPQAVSAEHTLEANGDIGFQAYLGFIISLDTLPLSFMIEAGYAQYNGNALSQPGQPPAFNAVSSTGPIVRFGIGFGK